MLQDLLEAIKPREERVELAGHVFLVRELSSAAEFAGVAGDPDIFFRLVVACTFDEAGARALTSDDIPALREGSRKKLAPLLSAVQRVNGLDTEDEVKKSETGPGSGSSTA